MTSFGIFLDFHLSGFGLDLSVTKLLWPKGDGKCSRFDVEYKLDVKVWLSENVTDTRRQTELAKVQLSLQKQGSSDSSGRPETKTSKFEFIRDHSSSYFVIPNVNLASNLCKYVNIIRITYVIFPKAWGWFKFIESLQNNWNFFYVVVTYAWPIKSTIQQSDVRTFYAPLKWTFRAH